MAGQRQSRSTVLLLSYAAVGCVAVAAIVLFVDGGDQERFLMQKDGAFALVRADSLWFRIGTRKKSLCPSCSSSVREIPLIFFCGVVQSVGQARLQSLAYTFTPEENPLETFDDGYKAKAYSYKEDPNPFENFEGYGFSTYCLRVLSWLRGDW